MNRKIIHAFFLEHDNDLIKQFEPKSMFDKFNGNTVLIVKPGAKR